MRTETVGGLLGLVLVPVLLVGCGVSSTKISEPAGEYVIRGEYIRVDPEAESVRFMTDGDSNAEEIDLSNALVVVEYQLTSEDGDPE